MKEGKERTHPNIQELGRKRKFFFFFLRELTAYFSFVLLLTYLVDRL